MTWLAEIPAAVARRSIHNWMSGSNLTDVGGLRFMKKI
jgi:hypothetical protein